MRRLRAGITLMELIVVIVILGIILGFAVYIFQSSAKNLSVPAAQTQIKSLIKFARDASRLNNAPSWVVIDTKQRTCALLVKEIVGQWHLEAKDGRRTAGAFGRDADLKEPITVVPGKIGNAFRLANRSSIVCPEMPVYHPRQGFAIEFWMYRDPSDARQTVAAVGPMIRIELRKTSYYVRPCTWCGKTIESDAKKCPLCGRDPVRVNPVPREGMLLSARAGTLEAHNLDPLAAYHWYKVEFVYAAGEARLYLNDILVGADTGTVEWSQSAPLVFGAAAGGYQGVLDELTLSLIVPREGYTLAPGVQFEFDPSVRLSKDGQYVLHFDREGRLDSSRHTGPVSFRIKSQTEEVSVTVELSGGLSK